MKGWQVVDFILGCAWLVLMILFATGVAQAGQLTATFMACIISVESFKNIFQRKV